MAAVVGSDYVLHSHIWHTVYTYYLPSDPVGLFRIVNEQMRLRRQFWPSTYPRIR